MHFLHIRELYSFAVFTIMITIISTVVSLVGLGLRDCVRVNIMCAVATYIRLLRSKRNIIQIL